MFPHVTSSAERLDGKFGAERKEKKKQNLEMIPLIDGWLRRVLSGDT